MAAFTKPSPVPNPHRPTVAVIVLAGPVRPHQEHAAQIQVHHHSFEQPERKCTGPLQVVHHHDQRTRRYCDRPKQVQHGALHHLHAALPAGKRGGHAVDSKALAPIVADALRPGDAVLVKGSLGSQMQFIIQAIDRPFCGPVDSGGGA